MPGMVSRAHMDGYKRLAASVIRRAIVDARAGDSKAESWLMGPMLPFSEMLDFDLERVHNKISDIISSEEVELRLKDLQHQCPHPQAKGRSHLSISREQLPRPWSCSANASALSRPRRSTCRHTSGQRPHPTW